MDKSLLQQFGIPHQTILLSEYTTFKTGGAALAAFPENTAQFCGLAAALSQKNLPFLVLGAGSNVLAPDEGLDALVIYTGKLNKIEASGPQSITAECGASLKDLSAFAGQLSLGGLEFACGIPGSVGGAVYMNAGAYEGEVRQVLDSSEVFWIGKNMPCTLSAEEHRFGYRKSAFMESPCLILKSRFQLNPRPQEEILALMEELACKRAEKQPLEYASAGSTFKRPEGYFAGKLIADAGLQGTGINGAEVSLKHAGFIVNKGGAKTKDILTLIGLVQKTVFERFGVHLEPEVRLLKPDGSFQNNFP